MSSSVSVSSLSRRRLADDFTSQTVISTQDGSKRSLSVKTNAKQGSLDDIPIKRVKMHLFPELRMYSSRYYPTFLTYNDYAFGTGVSLYNIYNTTTVPATETVGLLKAVQVTSGNVGKGNQVLVQYPIFSQLEFAQLTNKLVTDNSASLNAYGTTLSLTNIDQTDTSSPWFHYRELFLEQYEQTFTFTNNTSLDITVELITWQPKHTISEVGGAGTVDRNQSPLGCLYQDMFLTPATFGWTNTAQPQGDAAVSFNPNSYQDSSIRIDNKAHKILNANYKKLHKTVVKLGPGETVSYNVAIPSQMCSNSYKDDIASIVAGSVTYKNLPAWRTFSRFLTVRALSRAVIDSEFTSTNVGKGLQTLGDVYLSVSCTKYVRARAIPFWNRTCYLSGYKNIIDWTGAKIDNTQILDTVVAAEQEQIDDNDDVQAMTVI